AAGDPNERRRRSCQEWSFAPARIAASRSGINPDPFHRRFELGWRGREAGNGTSVLLAAGGFAVLHSASGGGHLPESADAARRRPLPMGQAWLQRMYRLYRCLEPLVA